MSVIKIVATIVVKPEYRQELIGVFQQLVLASRQEVGNLRYDLHQDIKNPNRVVFFEIWQSQAAVDEHGATAHFQSFLQAIDGKTETVDIVLLDNLSNNANQ